MSKSSHSCQTQIKNTRKDNLNKIPTAPSEYSEVKVILIFNPPRILLHRYECALSIMSITNVIVYGLSKCFSIFLNTGKKMFPGMLP